MKRLTIPLAVLALCATAAAQQAFEWKNEDASSQYADNYIPTVASGYALVKKIVLDDQYDLGAVMVIGWDRGISGDTVHVKVMADNNGLPDPNRILFHDHRNVTVDGRIHGEVLPASQPVRLAGPIWVSVQMERAIGYISYDPFRNDTDYLWDGSMIGKAIMQQGGRWVVSRGGSLSRTYSIRLQLTRPGGGGPPPDDHDDHHHGDRQPPVVQPPDPLQEMLNALDVVFRGRTKNFRVRPSKNFYYYADDQASYLGAIYVPFWLEGVNTGDQVTVRVEGIPDDFAIDAGGELSSLVIAPHNGYGMRGLYYRLFDGRRYWPMEQYSGWSERAATVECHGCCPFEGTSYTGGGTIELTFRVTRSWDRTFRGYLILGIDEEWSRCVQGMMSRQR